MARKHEPLTFSGSLEVQSQKPLDGRRKVALVADLTDAASFPYIFKGLDVFCEENDKWYTFLGGDSTDANNWREEGSGGGGSTDWSDITNKPTDLVQDASYQHTDNNYTTSDKDKLASLENYDDTALAARVTANETAIADRYTKAQTDEKIAEGIATVDSEHFHPVTVLPDVADAKENHEYILIEYEQDGVTIKSKTFYLFYDGAYHEDRAAGVSLDGYATEQYVDDGLVTKQDTITGGTEGDVLVKASDTDGDFSWRHLGKDNMIYDVLWETPTPDTWVNPVLSRSVREYDMILFEGRQQDGKWCQSFLNVADLGIGEEKELLINGFSWITIKFTDDTHIVGVNGTSSATVIAQKVTGIVFSRLDGTIGRWEKIGEWTTTTENIPLDLSSYQVLALTSYGGNSNIEKRNTAIIRMEDFIVGTELESHIIADVYVYFKNLGNGLYKFGNARTGGGILYGYKEAAISDADVQRIAAQVRPVPDGGTTGQALVKLSDNDGDAGWGDVKIDVDQTYDATSTNPQSGTAVAEAVADKQDVLTAGRGVEILPDGTINMTKNLMRHTDVLWEGSYGDVRAGAITLSSSITEYDEICIVMGNAFQAVAQTLGLVSLRCNNDYDQSASAYAFIIVSFNGNTATVDGAKRGQNGDSRYILRSPLTNVLGIKYDTTGGGGDVDSALSDTSENPVQNKIIKAELDKKAEGYIVPEILTPVDLETAGQPSFTRAGQIFMLSQRGVVGGQRYTFTQADVDNLVNVTDQNGITFTVTSSGGDSTQITMLGTPPSNVIYMPNMALSGTTAAFLIDPEEVHQIDARLIPGGGGTVDAYTKAETDALLGNKSNLQVASIPGGGGGNEIKAIVSQGEKQVEVNYYKNTELPKQMNFNVDGDAFSIPTTGYVDEKAAQAQNNAQTYAELKLTQKQDKLTSGTNIKTVNGESLLGAGNIVAGMNLEVGKEKWYGTYTDENGETFQVYSKMVYIPALPATAGITTYDHGVSNIKQILNIYGFTADGFVLNAPRQNAQDNIAIYQASKSATNQTFSIEVGKDRSSKKAYVVMVYAKNN